MTTSTIYGPHGCLQMEREDIELPANGAVREFIPGPAVYYYLNGELITSDEAQRIIRIMRQG